MPISCTDSEENWSTSGAGYVYGSMYSGTCLSGHLDKAVTFNTATSCRSQTVIMHLATMEYNLDKTATSVLRIPAS